MGPISKASDGNDRDGNDELGIKHPICESTDVSSLTEICAIRFSSVNKKSFEHQTSSRFSDIEMNGNDI